MTRSHPLILSRGFIIVKPLLGGLPQLGGCVPMSLCNAWSAPTHLTCRVLHPPPHLGAACICAPQLGAVHLQVECRGVCVCPRRSTEVPRTVLLTNIRAPSMAWSRTPPGTFIYPLSCHLDPIIHCWRPCENRAGTGLSWHLGQLLGLIDEKTETQTIQP